MADESKNLGGRPRDDRCWWVNVLAIRLVRHLNLPGRIRMTFLEDAEALRLRGLISARRRIACPSGARLDTWVLPARGAHAGRPLGTVLFVHGLWDSKVFLFPAARRAARAGFDAVLVDLPGHGLSTGTYVTYGAREVPDLLAVLARLRQEGLTRGEPFVVGFSMGGGIAVQLASACEGCRGLIALAPVASAERIMRRMLRILCPPLPQAAMDRVIARAGHIAGFDPAAVSAVDAARSIRFPAAVAHGRLDFTVPISHGRAIFGALAGPKRWMTAWAAHQGIVRGREDWIARQLVDMAGGAVQ